LGYGELLSLPRSARAAM